MRRFHRLALTPDLFGGCTLVREWSPWAAGDKFYDINSRAKDIRWTVQYNLHIILNYEHRNAPYSCQKKVSTEA